MCMSGCEFVCEWKCEWFQGYLNHRRVAVNGFLSSECTLNYVQVFIQKSKSDKKSFYTYIL